MTFEDFNMNGLLVLMSVFLLAAARPEPVPELPSHQRDVSIDFLKLISSDRGVVVCPNLSECFVSSNEINVYFCLFQFTDPTRSRSNDEAPKPHHHVVKRAGSGTLGTRIGFGNGPDPNQYWKFGEDANPEMMETRVGDGPDPKEHWAFYP